MDRFTVLHDDNGSFVDHSIDATDFNIDSFGMPLVAAEDYLYVGLYKKFSFFFVDFEVKNTASATFSGEYYNGTSWVALSDFIDRSKGFTRAGFMEWDLDQEDWAETTVNSKEMFWVRFKPDADMDAGTELSGLGIVFANDDDLREEVNQIEKYLPSGKNSFIQYHQTVKKDMVQLINNRGRKKQKAALQGLDMVTEFDLLRPEELRQAAKYRALEKIFFQISDNVEDKYYQRYLDYRAMATDAFDLFYLTIDTNDDGEISVREKNTIERVKIRIL